MIKRGLETIQISHQCSHLFSQLIFILKTHLVDNNERIKVHFLFFIKVSSLIFLKKIICILKSSINAGKKCNHQKIE